MRPFRTAAFTAGIYLVLSLVYILASTYFAADVAVSPEEAMIIEMVKGSAFVTISTLLIFGLIWKSLTMIEAQRKKQTQLSASLIQRDHRATTGLLAASIAHDAGNEIAILKANCDALQDMATDPEERQIVDDQQQALKRLHCLTDRLVDISRTYRNDTAEEIDFVQYGQRIANALSEHSRFEGVALRFRPDADALPAHLDPGALGQILVNLLFNAADATGPGGVVELRLSGDDSQRVIEVHDDGPGVDDDARQQLFDAFYTTKEKGTGLGLFSVKACLKIHQGSIDVSDSPLGGALFRVNLPVEPHPQSLTDAELTPLASLAEPH